MAIFQGSPANDLITGTSGSDVLAGLLGDDTLSGGAGADWILGGRGNDDLQGGAGDDWLVGGEGDDWLNAGAGRNVVYGDAGLDGLGFDSDVANAAGVGVRVQVTGDLTEGGRLSVTTADGHLVQSTWAWGVDRLAGGGTAFADTMTGGTDDDAFWGNGGDDGLMTGDGNDFLDGGDGDDVLDGGKGNDLMYGGQGRDGLWGEEGNDTLYGGQGADAFVFGGTTGQDVIADFSFAEGDRIQIAPDTTWTVAASGADAVVDFGGGNTVTLLGVSAGQVQAGWFVTV